MRCPTFHRVLSTRPASTPIQHLSQRIFLLLLIGLLLLVPMFTAWAQNGHTVVAASSSRASRNYGLGQIATLPDSDLQGTLDIVSQDLPKEHILSYFLDT